MNAVGHINVGDLRDSLSTCLTAFLSVAEEIECVDILGVSFASFNMAWSKYYGGPFAQFDRLLCDYVQTGGDDYQHFLPVCISHYNTDRLMEVLGHEIGDGTFGESRIPERIDDLVAISKRLKTVLQAICETRGP